MWGVAWKLSRLNRSLDITGSTSKTSNEAVDKYPLTRQSRNSSSSIIPPLAQLTMWFPHAIPSAPISVSYTHLTLPTI